MEGQMSILEQILTEAKNSDASDVHITVGIPPKMRIKGQLITMVHYGRMLPPDTKAIADSIVNESQRARFEENGQLDMSFSVPAIGRFRANVFKQRSSIALAFRLVATEVPDAQELGIPQSVVDLYNRRRGLVLVTGPTGSGKSTTLASIIDQINSHLEAHIITLEDPIEFLYRHDKAIVNQREIGLGKPKLKPESDRERVQTFRRKAAMAYRQARRCLTSLAFDAAREPLCETITLLAKAWAIEKKQPEPQTARMTPCKNRHIPVQTPVPRLRETGFFAHRTPP